jgi:hypothetical protein
LPVLLYIPLRWALGRLIDAVNDPRAHRVLNLTSAAALVMGLAGTFEIRGSIGFAQPVTPTYAAAITEFAYEMTGAGVRALGPAPSMESNMVRIHGADVFLIFLESYGVTSWDRPEFARPLAESRARFEHDIRESGRSVVSARVESTTFGGESWLAHISLISGTEVRDQRTNVRLMAQERDTLVKAFGRRGYRTVAIMPGLLREWPQGGFYGFDEVYNLERLDYQGPPFGWWSITDQFALARMDALEVANRREKPLFVFFPTISTHAPFTPAPPYQADWARILTPDPYDQADLERAWIGEPDWGDLGPSYVEGMKYAYATLGGYLRFRTGRDWVVMVIGDHQPPALVTGENAPHDVPAHIIASRQDLLDRFKQRGFRDGLAPHSPPVARMDTLLPILLDAFGDVVPQPQTVGRVFSSSAAAHQ